MGKSFLRWMAVLIGLVCITAGTASAYFADAVGHWSAAMVTALEAHGILTGDERQLFSPDAPMTRAQMAKILVEGLGHEEDARLLQGVDSRYRDVPATHWAKGHIEAVTELGLLEGFPDGSFGPDSLLTRAEMAVVLIRVAGLSERSRLSRFEQTSFQDDALIPTWARGAVVVASLQGLIQGMPDGRFWPDLSVTKAEGAVTLARIMDQQGRLYHLTGTLVQFDPRQGEGRIRDAMGQEHSFELAPDIMVLRQGGRTQLSQVRLTDQVWLILNEKGQVRFIDAWSKDLLATKVEVIGGRLRLTLDSGQSQTYVLQVGALVFLNGRPAEASQTDGEGPTYVALDQVTGEIRYMDVVRAPISGEIVAFDERTLWLEVGEDLASYRLTEESIFVKDGAKVGIEAFAEGQQVQIALDAEGNLSYMQVKR